MLGHLGSETYAGCRISESNTKTLDYLYNLDPDLIKRQMVLDAHAYHEVGNKRLDLHSRKI